MYLRSLATAVPPRGWSQLECWIALQQTEAVRALGGRARQLLEKVLTGPSGIERRHFAVEEISNLPSLDAKTLNETFEKEAVALGARALKKALDCAGYVGVDALFVCTCTGYLCPGLSSHVAELLHLDRNVYLADVTGAGCGAAIPSLRAAQGYLSAHPGHRAAVLAVEVCSAAFYLSEDPGVLVSACLFGDGAAAMVLEGASLRKEGRRFADFDTLHWPEHREKVRFVNRDGKLCNQLHRSVPEVAARAVAELYQRGDFSAHKPVCHAGGRDVLDAVEAALGGRTVEEARGVLRDFGNMSSPSVLFALERALASAANAERYWITSYGAGFAAHSCTLSALE
jgi:predicted naringenin-chalcone synthase